MFKTGRVTAADVKLFISRPLPMRANAKARASTSQSFRACRRSRLSASSREGPVPMLAKVCCAHHPALYHHRCRPSGFTGARIMPSSLSSPLPAFCCRCLLTYEVRFPYDTFTRYAFYSPVFCSRLHDLLMIPLLVASVLYFTPCLLNSLWLPCSPLDDCS